MKIDGIPNPTTMEEELKRMPRTAPPAPAVRKDAAPTVEIDDDLYDLLCFEKDKWTPCG